MSNRLAFLEAGAYCTATHCRLLPVNHCVLYCSHDSLLLTAFAVVVTQFDFPTKNITISKHCQLAVIVGDDSTP